MTRRVLLEVGHTAKTGLNTGIQRVVRNLANRMRELAPQHQIEVVTVALEGPHLIPVSIPDSAYARPEPAAAPAAAPAWRWRESALRAYLLGVVRAGRHFVAALVPSKRFRNFLLAPRHLPGLSRWLWTLARRSPAPAGTTAQAPVPRGVVVDPANDILLLVDSSWMDDIWPAVRELRTTGLPVAAVVYDLIPVSHPQFCDDFVVTSFHKWLAESIGAVDQYCCISGATRDALAHYLDGRLAPGVAPRLSVFAMGATLPRLRAVDPAESARAALRGVFSAPEAGRVFLTVSTLEPRKNHKLLLDAFDLLWAAGSSARLCIVGKIGWKVEDFLERAHAHPELGRKLFLFHDLTDDELTYAYRSSYCLLFPSFVEGYGLPIIEALHHGLPVLASDTPSHREAGGARVGYFAPDDPARLAALVDEFVRDGVPGRLRPVAGEMPSWEASAESLLALVQASQPAMRTP